MFRRTLTALLIVAVGFVSPLAQACATQCTAHQSQAATEITHDSAEHACCPDSNRPLDGSSQPDSASMASLCVFAAAPAMTPAVVSVFLVQNAPAPIEFAPQSLSSLSPVPPDEPPRG